MGASTGGTKKVAGRKPAAKLYHSKRQRAPSNNYRMAQRGETPSVGSRSNVIFTETTGKNKGRQFRVVAGRRLYM